VGGWNHLRKTWRVLSSKPKTDRDQDGSVIVLLTVLLAAKMYRCDNTSRYKPHDTHSAKSTKARVEVQAGSPLPGFIVAHRPGAFREVFPIAGASSPLFFPASPSLHYQRTRNNCNFPKQVDFVKNLRKLELTCW